MIAIGLFSIKVYRNRLPWHIRRLQPTCSSCERGFKAEKVMAQCVKGWVAHPHCTSSPQINPQQEKLKGRAWATWGKDTKKREHSPVAPVTLLPMVDWWWKVRESHLVGEGEGKQIWPPVPRCLWLTVHITVSAQRESLLESIEGPLECFKSVSCFRYL